MRRFALLSTSCVLACFSEPNSPGEGPDETDTTAGTTDVAPETSGGSEGGSSSDSGITECDPSAVADGVFVSADGGDDVGGDGTAARPVATIGTAITIALATEQRTLYLDEGNYTEAVVLPDAPLGLAIEGGWVRVGTQWSIDCSDDVAERTVISSTSSFVIEASGVVHPSAIRRVTIATKAVGASLPDESGESIYGVRVLGDDSVLALDDVIVSAGRGGDGGIASEGVLGVPALPPEDANACDGLVCDDGASGASAAMPGAPASTAGRFVDAGFVAKDGEAGSSGADGHAGTASAMGPDSANDCIAACACNNNSCGHDGLVVLSGAPGRCGCGGGAGGGGNAGRGGGATVALFVSGANATVSLSRARLSTESGGDGSPGAAGGGGGAGSDGRDGEATTCFTSCATGGGPCANCYSAGEKPLDGGAAGGAGGSGGAGSAGGAGAGGDAWAIVLVGGAKVIANDDVVLGHGGAGMGAGSGAAKAPDGAAGEVLEVD